jgi:hypothetical protein
MLKNFIIFAIISLCVISCDNEKDETLENTQICPLKVGNFWKYTHKNYSSARDSIISIDTLMYSVTEDISFNGEQWYRMQFSNSADLIYFTNRTDGLWIATLDNVNSTELKNTCLMIKYPTAVGDSAYNSIKGYALITKDVNYKINCSLGNFTGIYYESEDALTTNKYKIAYIPGVGYYSQSFISYINSSQSTPDTIRTFEDLIEYKLN